MGEVIEKRVDGWDIETRLARMVLGTIAGLFVVGGAASVMIDSSKDNDHTVSYGTEAEAQVATEDEGVFRDSMVFLGGGLGTVAGSLALVGGAISLTSINKRIL